MIRFFKIIGGEDDGAIMKLRTPLEVETIRVVKAGEEEYKVLSIEDETAVLELVISKAR